METWKKQVLSWSLNDAIRDVSNIEKSIKNKDKYNFLTKYITINGNQILVRRSSHIKDIQLKKYIFKHPYQRKIKILYCEKCNTFRKTKFCTKCKNKLYNVQDFDIESIHSEPCSVTSKLSYISDDGSVVLDKKYSDCKEKKCICVRLNNIIPNYITKQNAFLTNGVPIFEDEGLRMDDSDD
ncbi:20212_t:CDS:2 [Cetraspora pellucida]|uniref:20212_t:CDS:1 n=1 Tax=Cetraspora pellucida TaxID=1433469 RepID=A0A9N9K8S7_9GLOM|nr:20212_t:CDS:2 [Cetraspora pellucida]